MVDRQDIDALLIGSLYGELSSADEARLQTHLEAHPADRTALDRLTHARDAVRRSRLLEVQLEPPQSVSAMLLQEAARRAPRKAQAGEGWFVRLRRSFLLHPAMGAAAMFVLVIGVAGAVYLRKGDQFAAPELAASRSEAIAAPSGAAASLAPATGAAAGSGLAEPAQAARPDPAAPPAASSPPADVTAAQVGVKSAYRVGLAEEAARPAKEAQAKADDTRAEPAGPAETVAAMPEVKAAKKAGEADRRAGPRSMLEVTTPKRAPKDLDEASDDRAVQAAPPAAEPAPPAAVVRGATPPADPRPAMSKAPTAAPPPPPPPPATATVARDSEDPSKLRQAPGAGGAGTASGGAFAGAPTGGEDKAFAPEADTSWAKDQHARLVTQVRAGRCGDAASTALALSSRAPAYYQQNVETDRALKACLPLINTVREREAERVQRARVTSKRAADEATKAKAAAPPPA
ncbi:MAG TPA: hypothetical protein VN253_15950, partial [Kofleriaceae bacterium]|nr:hypothetical protein [Kofleriaceae bacterium]